jgi:hypothetical protein
VVDLKSHDLRGSNNAIAALGPAYRLLPNVWIVSTDQTVSACATAWSKNSEIRFPVRSGCLAGKGGVVQFRPEADVRIRRVWQKASSHFASAGEGAHGSAHLALHPTPSN